MLYTEADLDMEYDAGYRKGYDNGYDNGYDDGYYTVYIYYTLALLRLRAELEEKEEEIKRLKNK